MTPEQNAAVNAYLESSARRVFSLGSWDCALFCADVLQCMTGRDFAAGIRGTYQTRDGYLASLPVALADLPEHFGLIPSGPVHGAVFWMPCRESEGGLGIIWQGRALQPGRRGPRVATMDFSTLKCYCLP